MKSWKTSLILMACVALVAGCISRKERVVVKEQRQPVIQERVIEKAPDSTTVNVH